MRNFQARSSPLLPVTWPDAGVTGAVRNPAQISAPHHAGPAASWLGLALRGTHSPPTCSHILPMLFKTGTVVSVLAFSWLFYFCRDGIGYCRASPARAGQTCLKGAQDSLPQGSPPQGMLLTVSVAVTTFMEAVWKGQRKGALLSNLTTLLKAPMNKRTFNNRIPPLVFIAPIAQSCFRFYFLNPSLCHNLPRNWSRSQVSVTPLCRPGD